MGTGCGGAANRPQGPPARTWKALLSQSTEHDVMSPMRCRFPEIKLVSVSQQPNTS